MKDKIIEILKNNEVTITDEYGGSEKAVLTDYYTDIAEEIVKLLATPAVVGQSEQLICPHCGKYKKFQGGDVIPELCMCDKEAN